MESRWEGEPAPMPCRYSPGPGWARRAAMPAARHKPRYSTTQAAISGIAGNSQARTGDEETGIAPIFDQQRVKDDLDASVTVTQVFGREASRAVGDYADEKRKPLQEEFEKALAANDKDAALQILDQVEQINREERVANVLIGMVTGLTGPALTKGVLSEVGDLMTRESWRNSMLSPEIVDVNGQPLSNISVGRLGGTRTDLDKICGTDNNRCMKNQDGSLATNGKGQYVYTGDGTETGGTWEYFMKTQEGQEANAPTGGVQGLSPKRFFFITYQPISDGLIDTVADTIVEAFAGPHDYIGGQLPGFYDKLGNARRSMPDAEITAFNTWAVIAVPIASPFAASTVPPEIWNALSVLMK